MGFRRWYERQLIESHAWLVTCFLCALGIAASLEAMTFRDLGSALVTLVFVFFAALLCWYALQRYRAIMEQAERLAEHSTCSSCQTYARFRVVDEYPRMNVQCRKCGNAWVLE